MLYKNRCCGTQSYLKCYKLHGLYYQSVSSVGAELCALDIAGWATGTLCSLTRMNQSERRLPGELTHVEDEPFHSTPLHLSLAHPLPHLTLTLALHARAQAKVGRGLAGSQGRRLVLEQRQQQKGQNKISTLVNWGHQGGSPSYCTSLRAKVEVAAVATELAETSCLFYTDIMSAADIFPSLVLSLYIFSLSISRLVGWAAPVLRCGPWDIAETIQQAFHLFICLFYVCLVQVYWIDTDYRPGLEANHITFTEGHY